MRRVFLNVGVGLLLTVLTQAADLQKFTDCRLLENPANDGDSFHVRAGERELILRLYFVDCPETSAVSDVDAKRVRDQARYFGLTEARHVVEFGLKAKVFTAEQLSKPFTVYTAFSSAMGRSTMPRYYAFVVTAEGQDLASTLVEHGLARSTGAHRETPMGVSSKEMADRLHDLEMQAMLARAGIWAQSDPASLAKLRAQERAEEQELKDFRDQFRKPVTSNEPIDLNTATAQELQFISGVGPVLATKIMAGRPYKSVEDLRRVNGVGPKTYERIHSLFKVAPPAP